MRSYFYVLTRNECCPHKHRTVAAAKRCARQYARSRVMRWNGTQAKEVRA